MVRTEDVPIWEEVLPWEEVQEPIEVELPPEDRLAQMQSPEIEIIGPVEATVFHPIVVGQETTVPMALRHHPEVKGRTVAAEAATTREMETLIVVPLPDTILPEEAQEVTNPQGLLHQVGEIIAVLPEAQEVREATEAAREALEAVVTEVQVVHVVIGAPEVQEASGARVALDLRV